MSKKSEAIRIYTDGSSKNQAKEDPGIGACGFVAVKQDEIVAEFIEHFPSCTSIRAELLAIYNALQWARIKEGRKVIYTDSRYCSDGFNMWMHNWKVKNWIKGDGKEVAHKDIWGKIYKLRNVATIRWVKAHSGNKWNEYIDRKVTIRKDG